ncbi:MAG: type IX secretion system membrane protein PorP/SprF [Flavobacteriales bacterium]|nr:type IX secretion system membrane protein PorP/SprF [Flavobacteriales bacterium]MCB9193282.1 type IX secretion system membrane protein PorP/SprF [Flavobacteriales bacterium]
MKRWISIAVLLINVLPIAAQQVPQYTQYVLNMFNINPAVAGSKDCIDVRLGFRKQWLNFPGAPTTGWASVHATLKQKRKPYIRNKHGIGLVAEADDTGPLGYSMLELAYAYHIQVSKGYYTALGLFAGVKQEKFDVGEVTVADYNDPVLDSKGNVLVYPIITPGLWMYNTKFWFGISLHQALKNKINGLGEDSRLTRHLMLTGGYRYRIGKHTSIVPSVLMKYSAGSPLALDVNAQLDWRRTLGLGVTYRNTDAIAFMVKVGFLKFFSLGYSYDITTSKLKVGSSNTHEIILGITPCVPIDPSKRIVSCPIFE